MQDSPRTYRERREAKADRLREWAGKREAKATADLARARQMADVIPFGQPILVGHHSERSDRSYRGKISATYDRAHEHADKAADFQRRAAGIESALDRSIYTDDPDAIEALEARIVDLEAERTRIKAYNASCRKGARDLSILTETEQRNLLRTAEVASYSLGKHGEMPSYHLTNLSGNISRNKKRLSQLHFVAQVQDRTRANLNRQPETHCERCGVGPFFLVAEREHPELCLDCAG